MKNVCLDCVSRLAYAYLLVLCLPLMVIKVTTTTTYNRNSILFGETYLHTDNYLFCP